MATLFRISGEVQLITPESKEQGFTDLEIRNLLGAAVQLVALDEVRMLFIQRKPSQRAKNKRATAFVRNVLSTREQPATEIGVIHGDALVVTYAEVRIEKIHVLNALTY